MRLEAQIAETPPRTRKWDRLSESLINGSDSLSVTSRIPFLHEIPQKSVVLNDPAGKVNRAIDAKHEASPNPGKIAWGAERQRAVSHNFHES